ncbi:hypothetical protein [Streptomyces termitum]|uniref:hypothetical protein n=1 Tax=Streptomyces termitum TaxID=67368 RepID=UPI00378ED53B
MTPPLRQRLDRAASLLLLFSLVGIDKCLPGRPGRRRLKKIAASDEVRRKCERTERDLRARAAEIAASSPWGPPLRTTLVDTCTRGGGRNHFDRNAPERPALHCVMRLHLYFVVDRPVSQVLRDLRSMSTPARWSGDSIDSAVRYYERRTYETPHAFPPSIGSRPGGEILTWDAPGDAATTKVREPSPRHETVRATCVSTPADLTLSALREHPGTLYEWTLTSMYHTVYRT